jgi:hypothetical protein
MLLKVAGSELNLSISEDRPVAVSSEHSVEASRFGLARCQVLKEESAPQRDLLQLRNMQLDQSSPGHERDHRLNHCATLQTFNFPCYSDGTT